jgi:uncharacterized membrane protein YdfJ with MMPL/SSD domain
MAAPALNIVLGYPTASSMPESFQSKQLNNVLMNEFPNISSTPILVIVGSEHTSWQSSDVAALASYTENIKKLPGVIGIQSPTIAGEQALKLALADNNAIPAEQRDALLSQVHGNKALVQIRFQGSPIGSSAQELIKSVRESEKPGGLTATAGGTSAEFVDLLSSLRSHLLPSILVIVIATFILMSLLLGSFVMPLTALIFNVLSLAAAFGVMVWVFQYGHFESLLGLSSTVSIDSLDVILICAIAFGLAMDYQIFLVSRIKEFYDKTGDTRHAIAMGLAKTGPIITSAALILVVVIGAFASGEVTLVKQIGIGLGIGILLDATIVRAFIVPATMELLGHYNWWAPKSWKKLAQRFELKH